MDKNNQKKLDQLRHSCAHLLAAAVMELWPDTKRTIGPAIENGFYYDFDFTKPISEEDLPKIEAKMAEILKDWRSFEREEISADEARKRFDGNRYKLELIEEFSKEGQALTIYKSGNFEDLCRGGHSENPSAEIGAFKLLSIAGAYWRGSEKNKMLTRIYGTCFPTQQELDEYLKMLEEAKKRDHKKLGKELDLFVFSDLVGPGLPLFTFKGALVRKLIAEYSIKLRQKIGYQEVHTPQINKAELFKVSGHYDKYKDGMFEVRSHYSEEEYYLKPMNCPQHTQIYASQTRSYRDLPIRIADSAMLYRDEKPGELSGLARLRAFSQDDGHAFCREDQIKDEFSPILSVIEEVMDTYGMSYYIRLSLRDENKKESYLGDNSVWEKSQQLLEELLKEKNIEYKKAEGEAAFYGPKMDLIAKDSLGREWQLSTIQIDFNMPVRFGLKYIGEDGKVSIPVMIHSAFVGSPDRFMGVLIEHYGGAFPTWLSPVQVQIIPIADRHQEYGQKVLEQLEASGVRVEIDNRQESMQAKIRDAQTQKIPYMIIVGDREQQENKVAVRTRSGENLNALTVDEFIEKIKLEIESKA